MTSRARREPALLLSRTDIAELMTRTDFLDAVEAAFRALADGAAQQPSPMHISGFDGGFHADLGEIVTGRKSGRVSATEITIFDSTGIAVQDAASAAWIYERARARGVGIPMTFDNTAQG